MCVLWTKEVTAHQQQQRWKILQHCVTRMWQNMFWKSILASVKWMDPWQDFVLVVSMPRGSICPPLMSMYKSVRVAYYIQKLETVYYYEIVYIRISKKYLIIATKLNTWPKKAFFSPLVNAVCNPRDNDLFLYLETMLSLHSLSTREKYLPNCCI